MGEVKNTTQLQRSVFRWVAFVDEERAKEGLPANAPKQHAQITAREVSKDYGVPEDHLIKYLTGEIEEANSCCFALPFTLLMVISYTLVCIGHDSVTPVNAVEDSITFDIESNANFAFSSPYIGHKTIYDVNSMTDYWSWMIRGFIPLVFQQERGWAEGRDSDAMFDDWKAKQPEDAPKPLSLQVPIKDRGFYMHYNRIVGGVRLQQEVTHESGCKSLKTLLTFYDRDCVGGLKYELYPEMFIARETTNPEREWWLWAADNVSYLINITRQKELEQWLDEQTLKIEIAIPVYNGQVGVHSIIFVDFFFSRGGHIWKRIIPMATYSQWFHGLWNIIPDTLWVLGLLWIVFSELYKMYQVFQVGGCKGIRQDYLSFWNVSDWTAVGCGFWIIVGLFFRWRNTQKLNDTLAALGDIDEVTKEAQYREQAKKYMTELEIEVMNAHIFRILLGLYPLLIIVRLFKAFSAQPRLSLVTKTLGSSAVDLFHFMLVFISIFMTYAVAGVVLFGRELDGFNNLSRATNTCFRCMMGDFDWEELQRVGRIEAGIWFISFMVIVVLLMMNMLLAIVMDAYSEQKELIGEAETLWQEFKQARARWKGQVEGRLVSLKEVLRAIRSSSDEFHRVRTRNPTSDLPSNVKSLKRAPTSNSTMNFDEEFCLVTVSSLQDACPRMREEQATELIEEAVMDYYNENKKNTNTEEMLRIIRKINYSTKKLKKYLKSTLASNYDELPEGSGPVESIENGEEEARGGEESFKVQTSMPDPSGPSMSFAEELSLCRNELDKAKDWIGEEELDATVSLPQIESETTAVTAAAIERYRNTVRKRMMQIQHRPLQKLEEVRDFSVKRVLEEEEAVLKACRDAGISTEKDPQRIEALGACVRVVERDASDNTIKVRVPGIGDVWFGLEALTDVRPQPGAEPPLTSQEMEEIERQQMESMKSDMADPFSNEEAMKKITDIEEEIRTGRQVVSEALHAVSELEWRVVKESEDKSKIAAKFQLLKKKVVQLTRENRRLKEEEKRQGDRLKFVEESRDEYHDLVSTLIDENKRLKSKMQNNVEQNPLSLADIPEIAENAQFGNRVNTLVAQVMDRPNGQMNGAGGRKGRGGNGGDHSDHAEIRKFREEVQNMTRNASPNPGSRDGSQQGGLMSRMRGRGR